VFPKPLFQYLVNTGASTRAVPDVSLQMGGCPFGTLTDCPPDRSFSLVVVGGGLFGVIGTSISSPDFAGLMAVEAQYLGLRLGNVNYQVYALGAAQNAGPYQAFHQGIPGFNGFDYSHQGVKGYDMVVGNGTVIGRNFILAPQLPAAGTPLTASNP
jgi:kumamolisin